MAADAAPASAEIPILDLHSHWGTRRGYRLRTAAELEQQPAVWGSNPSYVTEAEMAAYFRSSRVRAILDLGFTKSLPIEQAAEYHDYCNETIRAHPDVMVGMWVNVDVRQGRRAVAEFERCLSFTMPFVGLIVSGTSLGVPASDPLWRNLYGVCVEAGTAVLILAGYTGSGANLPGGNGYLLDHCHPRHIDQVAATHPSLQIIAGRPAWPWQDEMIAVLLHKPNVVYELHGWSPKYFTEPLQREIRGRLRRRVMFGGDYPLFTYERLRHDWGAGPYDEETLERVFHLNALEYLPRLPRCSAAGVWSPGPS